MDFKELSYACTIRYYKLSTGTGRRICAILAACQLMTVLVYVLAFPEKLPLVQAESAGGVLRREHFRATSQAPTMQLPIELLHQDVGNTSNENSELTMVAKTMDLSNSSGCLKRLLASIPKRLSNAANFVIAHEGPAREGTHRELLAAYGGRVQLIELPVDAGLSVGRNELIRAVKTPYFLLVDDDFVVPEGDTAFMSSLESTMSFVRSGDFHIVGGITSAAACAYQYRRSGDFRTTLDISLVHCNKSSVVGKPAPVDAVDNFFLGSTAHVRRVLWDPALKVGEHEDFFLRAQDRLKIGFWPSLAIVNDRTCRASSPEGEAAFLVARSRALNFWKRTFSKHALTDMHTPAAKYSMRCEALPGSNIALEPLYVSSTEPCTMEYTDLKYPFPWGDKIAPVPDSFPQLAIPGSLQRGPSPCRVAVATMATGRYMEFVPDFWRSAGQFLLPQCTKHLFLFTDRKDALLASWGNVTFLGQEKLGWPFDSVMRFEMYLSLKEVLTQTYDYFYAIDSDALFVAPVGQEILGRRVASLSAWFHGRSMLTYPTDANPASPFYVPSAMKRLYFAGGLFGGKVAEVMSMLGRICPQIRALLSQPVPYLPPWHDESILNHEFNVVAPPDVILGPEYLFPEPPASNWLLMQQRVYYYGRQEHFLPTRAPKLYNLGVRKATDLTLRDSPFVPITGSTVKRLAAVKPMSCSAVHHLSDEPDVCVHWIPNSIGLTEAVVDCASRAMQVCTSFEAQRMAADGIGLCQPSIVTGPLGEECSYMHTNQWCDAANAEPLLQCAPEVKGQALCCSIIESE